MANAVLQCGHMMANRDCFGGETQRYKTPRRFREKGRYLPVSSGNKEGLRARIEGVERFEAVDEGLEGTRGIEREKDVECIQSPTARGRRADANNSGRRFPFHSYLDTPYFFHNLGVTAWPSCLCGKPPDSSIRGHNASCAIPSSLLNKAQPHIFSIHPFEY